MNELNVNKKIIFEDVDDNEPKKSKKKKKVIQNDNESGQIEKPDTVKKQKKSKKIKKNTESEPDISLGDLHLEEFFNMSKDATTKEDLIIDDGNVFEDENLTTKKTKKRKRTMTETEAINGPSPSPKKRKRSSS